MIKIIFAGTGTPGIRRVDKVRACASEALQIGEDILLFDCGRWVTSQLLRCGLPPYKINYLFFTHIFHIDHTSDYPNLLFYREMRPSQLNVFGPQGTLEFSDQILKVFKDFRAHSVRRFLSIRDVDEGVVHKAEGWEVACVRTTHRMTADDISLAYKVNAEGKSIVISGDITYSIGERLLDVDNAYAYNEKLLDLAREADLFIMDADLVHTTPADMARAAEKANAKRIILTHIIPPRMRVRNRIQKRYDEMVAEMKEIYHGEITVAEDLKSLTL